MADQTEIPSLIEQRVAAHLANEDGWNIDDDSWATASGSLRAQYLALAREVIVLVKGPTVAAQAIANMGAEIRELTKERDRYRDAWHNARHRAYPRSQS